jgi:hypothetical protein
VLVGVALVTEVLRELVDLLEPAYDEPLQVELIRDAEVEVGVEQLGVGHERLGEAAAVAAAAGIGVSTSRNPSPSR